MEQYETDGHLRCDVSDPVPGCRVVRVVGDIDAHSAPSLQEKLLRDLEAAPRRLVLDLTDVNFLDSAGIRVLITLCRHSGQPSERLRLVMPRREGVRRALDLVAIERLIPLAETAAAGLPENAAAGAE